MRLTFDRPHISITSAVASPNDELADFVILSGPNGSGKSHLLQAIQMGAVRVDDIVAPVPPRSQLAPIRLFTLAQLGPPQERAQNPASFDYTWMQLSQAVERFKAQYGAPTDPDELEKMIIERLIFDQNMSQEALRKMLALAGKPLLDFTDDDYFKYAPIIHGMRDPFSVTVGELFLTYNQRRLQNKYHRWLVENEDEDATIRGLSDDEFLGLYGPPPWDLFNDLIARVGLDYQFSRPESGAAPGRQYQPLLTHKETGLEIATEALSSGERTLMAVAMTLYAGSRLGEAIKMPDVLLLDEPDASLHPSMTRSLLHVANDLFCKEYGVKVILVTHAPTTVALAPEESLYTMSRTGEPRLRKASRDEALSSLMVGLPTLSVTNENRRQVFVESPSDESCYQELFRLLKDTLGTVFSLEFIASGKGGQGNAQEVMHLVARLRASGNLVQGIVDRDQRQGAPEGIAYIRSRYTIENLVLDPLLVGVFLLRERIRTSDDIGLVPARHFDLTADHVQVLCDYVVGKIQQPGDDDERVLLTYVNGYQAGISKFYLNIAGHDLEARLRKAFPEFNNYPGGRLKRSIIEMVLGDLPHLAPQDAKDLFVRLIEL